MTDNRDDAIKALWQSQSTEVPAMSASYLRHRADELQRALGIRNALEQGTCIAALAGCVGAIFLAPHPWIKAAATLLLAGTAWAMLQWKRRVAALKGNASESTEAGIVFYKRELQRMRDFHLTIWRWYLLPMMPGVAAILVWSFFGDPQTRGTWTPWSLVAMLLIWIGLAVIYERNKASQFQRELDAIAVLESEIGGR